MRNKEKSRKQLKRCVFCLAVCGMLLIVLLEPVMAKTVSGTTSKNGSKYDFNCVYTLSSDAANSRYKLEVTAQLKIIKYKFSTTKTHKVHIKINGETYTKTFNGLSGGNNSSTVTKNLYTKTVYFAYGSAARTVPVSITTTDISSGGYGPGVCKASANVTIPAVSTSKTLSGSIIWQDNNNQDGLRSTRTVTIMRDGQAYTSFAAGGAWSVSVPVYKAGGGVSSYGVTGNALSGYTGPVVSGYNLIYSRTAYYTTDVSGEILWEDLGNVMNNRPASVEVKVMKGDAVAAQGTAGPGADGKWSYRFTGLPKYEGGKEIAYRPYARVAGYETECRGFNIINTWIPAFDVRAGFSI